MKISKLVYQFSRQFTGKFTGKLSQLSGQLALAAGLTMFLSSCAFHVAATNPRPNFALPRSQGSIKLVFAYGVEDKFSLPTQNNIMGGDVEGWRATLENGFKNGFADSFRVVGSSESADYTLTLNDALPELVPTAVAANGAVVGGTAQLRYKASLVGQSGERRSAGTVAAKKTTTRRDEIGNVMASSVETMYEQIAKEMFIPTEKGNP